MGEQYKLDTNGTCELCKEISLTVENLQCFMCKDIFHGACSKMSEVDKVGTKSLITAFNRPSTQKNFKFFCDCCLTKFENDAVKTETNRLNTVEVNISTIKSELEEIKNMLKDKSKPTRLEKNKHTDISNVDNIWFNPARLKTTKVPPAEPMLVLKNIEDVSESVEKAIVENSISATKSFKNNSGNLVVICDNDDSRDKLRDIIASTNENVEMKSVTKKKRQLL